jgi:aryl-alcohol dehydrogenase-like predicted oxidoreductase
LAGFCPHRCPGCGEAKTIAEISLNWLLQRPTVDTIIIGARNEEQLKQNLDAVGWNLTIDQVKD